MTLAKAFHHANIVLLCNVATEREGTGRNNWAGTGHWVRCHTLATALKSIARHNTTIVVGGHANSVARLAKNHEDVLLAEDKSINQLRRLAPDLIISDINYLVPQYMCQMRRIAPVINLAPRGLPKYFADATITSTSVNDVPCPTDGSRTRWHRGPDYSIIRPEIVKRKPPVPPNHRKQRILISMGGVDQANLTQPVVSVLLRFIDIAPIDIIVGDEYPHIDALRPLVARFDKLELHVQPRSFVDLLDRATIAVLSVGNVVDEALTLGTAVIGYPLTDYHAMRARELSDVGAMLGLPRIHDGICLENFVSRLIVDHSFRDSLTRTGWLLVDGRGTHRAVEVCQEILGGSPPYIRSCA